MKLKDIAPENRPRERLARCGPDVLSDAELLAIILKTGNREENAVDLANRLISKHGLGRLSSCSLSELSVTPGIGLAKACQILAVFELARRFSSSMLSSKPLESAKDVFDYLSPKMSDLEQEHFVVLHLDSKNRVKKHECLDRMGSLIFHRKPLTRGRNRRLRFFFRPNS